MTDQRCERCGFRHSKARTGLCSELVPHRTPETDEQREAAAMLLEQDAMRSAAFDGFIQWDTAENPHARNSRSNPAEIEDAYKAGAVKGFHAALAYERTRIAEQSEKDGEK